MKIKLEIEIDTENEQDLNTIEELMEKLRELKELMYEWYYLGDRWQSC